MPEKSSFINRRDFLKTLGGLGLVLGLEPSVVFAKEKNILKRKIPSSGESIPVIGMGSWITFDVGNDPEHLHQRIQVLKRFFQDGGGMIDSSPMYGSSEEVIGKCLQQIKNKDGLFSATKVWIWGKKSGVTQMLNSLDLWKLKKFDLMQIHNMLDWETHLETLKAWKAEGKIRYIGITTSHGRRHDDLEMALKKESFDFVQFTYNLMDREVEQRLLPLAAERGTAVIINRPFRGGELFDLVQNKPLPGWAEEFDCKNWAQFFLKFIVSHPNVTCAIPATSQVPHMAENMGACVGRLPDARTRKRMLKYFMNL